MKHLFIPYKLAVTAKEKGFNEPCLGCYDLDSEEKTFELTGLEMGELRQKSAANLGYIIAPLYQQIVDWFELHKGIFIMVYPRDGWNYMIQRMDNSTSCVGDSKHGSEKTKIETLNKAIEQAFKLI